ncbi:MAG: FmdB family zinc ribbon protein [Armatimonadota bacterium]
MPTYVYECSSCEKTFELEQRITEDPIKDCQCGSNGTVKRVIQPVGIAFKGSGFYVNDSSSVSSTTSPAPVESCTGDKASCACSSEA